MMLFQSLAPALLCRCILLHDVHYYWIIDSQVKVGKVELLQKSGWYFMFKIILVNLMLAVLLMVQGCGVNSVESEQAEKPQIPLTQQAYALSSRQSCEAEGGAWQKLGKLQREACVLSASDAGKSCSNKSDCEVTCITMERGKTGSEVVGQCYHSTNLFGCRTYVSSGVAQPTLCID